MLLLDADNCMPLHIVTSQRWTSGFLVFLDPMARLV
jgi:hypothetical protein